MVHGKVRQAVTLSMIAFGAAAAAVSGLARAQQSAPVLDSVTLREDIGGRYPVVYPEFHFHDPSGTARFIHREVVATNARRPLNVQDGIIDISSAQQIQGATYVGGWPCGADSYYVTLRAFILNLEGGRSNAIEYTIHCNGG
jgi:hypothetical protein